jgi:hypothetical protein
VQWLELIGPLAGVLGLTVAVLNAAASRRSQEHNERADDERMGHTDLVDALEARRAQLTDCRLECAAHKLEAERWEAIAKVAQDKVTDLLYLLETRRDMDDR